MMNSKLAALIKLLDSMGTVGIGYSGGVDSTFLAAACARHLRGRAVLLHLENPFATTPEREAFARDAERFDLPVVRIPFDALDEPEVAANPPDRCYHCKRAGFRLLVDAAREHGCNTVVDGSNADDQDDYRPGMRALAELGVRSPLMEAGFSKQEERELLRLWGFDVWGMPAGACLATRIPNGERLSAEKLEIVRACEDHLRGLGLEQVRVRLEEGRARVSAAPEDLCRLARIDGCRRTPDGQGVELSPKLLDVLKNRGAHEVDECATPYIHGALSVGEKRTEVFSRA